jgi:hypothetical protein
MMAGLRRTMDNQIKRAFRLKEINHFNTIADVYVKVPKMTR